MNSFALAPYARSWHEPERSALTGRTWIVTSLNLLQGNKESGLVLRYLRETRADMVVLQEVSPRWAVELEALSDLYPYRFIQPSKDQFGLALLSREKPIAQSIHTIGHRVGDLAVFGTWQSGGHRFSVAGIHADKPDKRWKTVNRAIYLGRIAQWAEERRKTGEALIVIGDFNATPWSASLRKFSQRTGLRNAHDGRIFSATWNVWRPQRLLIDHAFLSTDWALRESVIGPDVGSDHRPFMVRATLPPA